MVAISSLGVGASLRLVVSSADAEGLDVVPVHDIRIAQFPQMLVQLINDLFTLFHDNQVA